MCKGPKVGMGLEVAEVEGKREREGSENTEVARGQAIWETHLGSILHVTRHPLDVFKLIGQE